MNPVHFQVPWEIFILPIMLVIIFAGAMFIYCYCLEPCCHIDPGGHLAPDPRIRIPTPIPAFVPMYSTAKMPVVLCGEELVHGSGSLYATPSKTDESRRELLRDEFHWDFSSYQSGIRSIRSGLRYARSKSRPFISASDELFRSRRDKFLQRCHEKLLKPPGKESKSHSGRLNIPKASTSFDDSGDGRETRDGFYAETEVPWPKRYRPRESKGGVSEDSKSLSQDTSQSIDSKSQFEEDYTKYSSEEFDSVMTDTVTLSFP